MSAQCVFRVGNLYWVFFVCVYMNMNRGSGRVVRVKYEVVFPSSLIKVQQSFLACLCVSVFPAERRVKMCWRWRAWRPLACCRAGFSLEADRHCRAVSSRLSISLPSIISSIFQSLPLSFSFSLSPSSMQSCQPPLCFPIFIDFLLTFRKLKEDPRATVARKCFSFEKMLLWMCLVSTLLLELLKWRSLKTLLSQF